LAGTGGSSWEPSKVLRTLWMQTGSRKVPFFSEFSWQCRRPHILCDTQSFFLAEQGSAHCSITAMLVVAVHCVAGSVTVTCTVPGSVVHVTSTLSLFVGPPIVPLL